MSFTLIELGCVQNTGLKFSFFQSFKCPAELPFRVQTAVKLGTPDSCFLVGKVHFPHYPYCSISHRHLFFSLSSAFRMAFWLEDSFLLFWERLSFNFDHFFHSIFSFFLRFPWSLTNWSMPPGSVCPSCPASTLFSSPTTNFYMFLETFLSLLLFHSIPFLLLPRRRFLKPEYYQNIYFHKAFLYFLNKLSLGSVFQLINNIGLPHSWFCLVVWCLLKKILGKLLICFPAESLSCMKILPGLWEGQRGVEWRMSTAGFALGKSWLSRLQDPPDARIWTWMMTPVLSFRVG